MRINSEMSVNAYNTYKKAENAQKPTARMESDTVNLSGAAASAANASKADYSIKDVAASIRQAPGAAFSAQANIMPSGVLKLLAD